MEHTIQENYSKKPVGAKIKPIKYMINDDGCWICTSHKGAAGYPNVYRNRAQQRMARYVYELKTGIKVPEKKILSHSCKNPACINPEHMRVFTQRESVAERDKLGRQSKGENVHSAKLTEADVINIRKEIARGIKQAELARQYNVAFTTINRIHRKRSWKHVQIDSL